MAMAFFGDAISAVTGVSGVAAPWNLIDNNSQSYLSGNTWAAQLTDIHPVTASGTMSASGPWVTTILGLAMSTQAAGGGAAGGPANSGYASTFYGGGPGYSGGGKGGLGAPVNELQRRRRVPAGRRRRRLARQHHHVHPGRPGGSGGTPAYLPAAAHAVQHADRAPAGPAGRAEPVPAGLHPFSDVPNNTEYTIVNPAQPSVNAEFNSTYTVILVNHLWNSLTLGAARTITVTVHQYEYPGGPASSVQVSRSVTPSVDIVNGLVNMGEVTLPIKDYAKFNDQSYFTVSINDTDQNDRYMDVLFLDTTGQTVLLNIDPSQPGYNTYVNYYIDEPTTDRDLGFIGGTCQDRQHNVSLMEYAFVSGGPLYIAAGDNLLLTYSPSGAPSLGLTYGPRWYLDRIV